MQSQLSLVGSASLRARVGRAKSAVSSYCFFFSGLKLKTVNYIEQTQISSQSLFLSFLTYNLELKTVNCLRRSPLKPPR
jgi:hypothetical protein